MSSFAEARFREIAAIGSTTVRGSVRVVCPVAFGAVAVECCAGKKSAGRARATRTADVNKTLNVYAHVTESMQSDAVDTLSRLLG